MANDKTELFAKRIKKYSGLNNRNSDLLYMQLSENNAIPHPVTTGLPFQKQNCSLITGNVKQLFGIPEYYEDGGPITKVQRPVVPVIKSEKPDLSDYSEVKTSGRNFENSGSSIVGKPNIPVIKCENPDLLEHFKQNKQIHKTEINKNFIPKLRHVKVAATQKEKKTKKINLKKMHFKAISSATVENKQFCLSIAHTLDEFSEETASAVKIKIMQFLHDVKYGKINCLC